MYTKPIFYKIYSIVIFAFAVLSSVGSVLFAVFGANKLNRVLPVGSWAAYLAVLIGTSLASLFFSYVEFTSMFTFAQMIEHEESGSTQPFRRMGIVFPPKFYKVFGNVLFYIPLVADVIAAVVLVISYSVTKKAFLAIPLIPLGLMLLSLLLIYITYYCRYRTFGDLLELKSSEEVGVNTLNSLGENKPNILRGYCVFLFILAIVCFLATIISLFFIAKPIATLFGSGMTVAICVGIIINAVVMFMVFAIIGCYYDNLAKMLEHYMIKYKLI